MGSIIQKFEDLQVWQESMKLAKTIYKEQKNCKDFGLRDQMQRASVSIPSNISEGFERGSNKEYIQFLFIAKASSGELRTQIYLSIDLKILNEKEGKDLLEQSRKVSACYSN